MANVHGLASALNNRLSFIAQQVASLERRVNALEVAGANDADTRSQLSADLRMLMSEYTRIDARLEMSRASTEAYVGDIVDAKVSGLENRVAELERSSSGGDSRVHDD